MVYTRQLSFSEGLKFWYMTGRCCLCDQPPIKTPGPEFPMSFPSRQHITYVVNLVAGEIMCPMSSTPGSLCLLFLRLHSICLFPFADLDLYPFAVIYHRCENVL